MPQMDFFNQISPARPGLKDPRYRCSHYACGKQHDLYITTEEYRDIIGRCFQTYGIFADFYLLSPACPIPDGHDVMERGEYYTVILKRKD
jgi:hypothetical protein